MTTRIITGDCRAALMGLADESVHCVVTSPPYYGLRDYGIEPQVWGGDPGCEHEWSVLTRQGIRLSDAHSTLGGGRTTQANAALAESKHYFCHRCNAWRGSLGLEPTPALWVEHMVAVFREVRRVLRKDGTLWLNIGDSYASGGRTSYNADAKSLARGGAFRPGNPNKNHGNSNRDGVKAPGLKPKDLLGVPWMLAFALRDDGWYLRSEITWAKRAPMPESVTDRPTTATEKVFLLTKSAKYFYDAEAVKEDGAESSQERLGIPRKIAPKDGLRASGSLDGQSRLSVGDIVGEYGGKRNMRNWWLLGPEPFPEAHFATFPTEIPRRAILAGTSAKGVCPKCGAPWTRVLAKEKRPNTDKGVPAEIGGQPHRNPGGGVGEDRRETETIGWRLTCCPTAEPVPASVLDPFLGAGTTALVADQLQRDCIGIDLNPAYGGMAERRIREDAGMFAEIAAE